MSSLDKELASLQKPIPKGIDLTWTKSGDSDYPSNDNNPNAQAANTFNQMIFNRLIQKNSCKDLLPEERAIAQTVVSYMGRGQEGKALYSSLIDTFGENNFKRHYSLISSIEGSIKNGLLLSKDMNPSVGMNVAISSTNGVSERDKIKNFEKQKTAGSLESYRNEKESLRDDISIEESELEIKVSSLKSEELDFTELEMNEIKLATEALISDSIESEDEEQQVIDEMIFDNDVKKLSFVEENDLLDEENFNNDINFEKDIININSFDMDDNGSMGCDKDLESLLAETPPFRLLEGDEDAATDDGIEEIELDKEKEQSDIGVEISDEFEIDI